MAPAQVTIPTLPGLLRWRGPLDQNFKGAALLLKRGHGFGVAVRALLGTGATFSPHDTEAVQDKADETANVMPVCQ